MGGFGARLKGRGVGRRLAAPVGPRRRAWPHTSPATARPEWGTRPSPGASLVMSKLIFRVRQVSAGWIVEDGTAIGPFVSKEQALDLAQGMVLVIRDAGQEAEYLVEDTPVATPRRGS